MFLNQWLNTIQHQVTEGGAYGWNCYGSDVYTLNSAGDQNCADVGVIFNPKTKLIYEASVALINDKERIAYRWIHPDYLDAYKAEVISRDVTDQACDGVDWIDLNSFDLWAEKVVEIRNKEGSPATKYETIQLDLDVETFNALARLAHEADITLNQYIENVLRESIDRIKNQNNT